MKDFFWVYSCCFSSSELQVGLFPLLLKSLKLLVSFRTILVYSNIKLLFKFIVHGG